MEEVRDVNCLLDQSVGVRKAALCRIKERLKAEGDELAELGHEDVIKALLRRFSDPSEKCRCLAVSILLRLLQALPSSVLSLLPYIVPVISERLPLKSLPDSDEAFSKVVVETVLVEPSEEVRLLLVQLLSSILNHAPRFVHVYASEIASIIMVTATDAFPDVLMETMALLERFASIMDRKIKPLAKQLTSVVLRSLLHSRYKVRVAALRAIHRLVLCGAHESIYELTAFQDPNLVPVRAFYQPFVKTQYLALLARDKTTTVRKELLLTVSSWLRELDERKEHEVRLLPYVVCAFNDPDPDLQRLAFEHMEEIGLQYEREYENEVKDMKEYFREAVEDTDRRLPAFKHRPCLGARILVKSFFSLHLHAIGADLDAWTSGTKELSANFLLALLFFVEDNVTMHLEPLCALLVRASGDPLVEKQILQCASVVGFFVDPSAYLAIMVPHLTGEVSGNVTVQHAGRTLKVLASLMEGSDPKKLSRHVPDICSTLTEQDLITSIDWDVNQGIVRVCKAMIAAESEECEEATALLWLLLNAVAAAEFCDKPTGNAEALLEELAKIMKYNSQQSFVASYAKNIMSMLPEPQSWIMRSLQPLIFCRLIKASTRAERDVLDQLLTVIEGCGSVDEAIKTRVLLALEDLIENSPGQVTMNDRNLLRGFVKSHGEPLSIVAKRILEKLVTSC